MVGNIPSVWCCFPFDAVLLQCPVAALRPHVAELEEQLSSAQTEVETLAAEIQNMRRDAEATELALPSVENIGAAINQVSPSPHAHFPLFFRHLVFVTKHSQKYTV